MKLTELPGLSFATADIEEIDLEVTSTVESLLGRKLARADPLRLFLRGVEQIIQQQRLLIDQCAKQNLLAYATGKNLDHLGALVGVSRLPPTPASATFELKLSAPRAQTTVIPRGTRFTAGDDVYFALESDAIIFGGETSATVHASCITSGNVGNDYLPREINVIADPQPFLATAVNITKSEGGSDREGDETFRERIHEAPESFSVAGPAGAYRYWAMTASALITDVAVTSPEPGVVRIYPLLAGGELPSAELMERVYEICNDRTIRPLTDKVEVLEPEKVEYRLLVEYYISKADATFAAEIDRAAQAAVREYVVWQRSALGRDITPTKLIQMLHEAGVKRVVLHSPEFKVLEPTQVAVIEVDSGLRAWCEAYWVKPLEDE